MAGSRVLNNATGYVFLPLSYTSFYMSLCFEYRLSPYGRGKDNQQWRIHISIPSILTSKSTKYSSMVSQAEQSQGKLPWPHLCYMSASSTTKELYRVEEGWFRKEKTYNLG